MTLMLLTALVDRLMVPSTWLLRYLNAKLGHLYQPFNIRVFHLLVIATVLIVFFFLVPAGVFNVLEPDWNYLDSIYYCFISLTTIGLGDYIPGDSPNQPLRPLYKIGTTGKNYLTHGFELEIALCPISSENSIPFNWFGLHGTDAYRILRNSPTQRRFRLFAEI